MPVKTTASSTKNTNGDSGELCCRDRHQLRLYFKLKELLKGGMLSLKNAYCVISTGRAWERAEWKQLIGFIMCSMSILKAKFTSSPTVKLKARRRCQWDLQPRSLTRLCDHADDDEQKCWWQWQHCVQRENSPQMGVGKQTKNKIINQMWTIHSMQSNVNNPCHAIKCEQSIPCNQMWRIHVIKTKHLHKGASHNVKSSCFF